MLFHRLAGLLLFFVLGTYLTQSQAQDVPKVGTPKGQITGTYKTSYGGRKFAAFEGIPYAKPPIGELRFEEPQSVGLPEGDFIAVNTSYTCMTFVPYAIVRGIHGHEDCLYLYIYVPKETITGNENLDVIVYIHGGAFIMGSPRILAKPTYIMDKDVIFVSFNYRLGLLGYMSTEDGVVPGNMGMKDQVSAMKWVKENIKYFGGNPDSITLMGLSAGAASTHYHYLSPLSKGLFNRGFSQSGVAIQNWALNKKPLRTAKTVAKTVGCEDSSTAKMVNCLKKTDATKLMSAIMSVFDVEGFLPAMPFGPVIEKGGKNPFLSEHPYKLLKEGKLVNDVPWMNSNVRDEGVLIAGYFYITSKIRELGNRWNVLAPYVLNIQDTVDESDMEDLLDQAWDKYIIDDELNTDNMYNLVKLGTDRLFLYESDYALRLHSKATKQPVYYYMFNYILEQIPLFPFMKKGSVHGDDGRLMYPTILSPDELPKNDEALMHVLINFIADYAAGKALKVNDMVWKPIDPSSNEITFLEINSPENITMRVEKELCDIKFWDSLPIKENAKVI